MFRTLIFGVVFSLSIVQANACDAYYDENGYRVDGGVVVQVLGSAPVEEAQVIQGQPANLSQTSDEDDSE